MKTFTIIIILKISWNHESLTPVQFLLDIACKDNETGRWATASASCVVFVTAIASVSRHHIDSTEDEMLFVGKKSIYYVFWRCASQLDTPTTMICMKKN